MCMLSGPVHYSLLYRASDLVLYYFKLSSTARHGMERGSEAVRIATSMLVLWPSGRVGRGGVCVAPRVGHARLGRMCIRNYCCYYCSSLHAWLGPGCVQQRGVASFRALEQRLGSARTCERMTCKNIRWPAIERFSLPAGGCSLFFFFFFWKRSAGECFLWESRMRFCHACPVRWVEVSIGD